MKSIVNRRVAILLFLLHIIMEITYNIIIKKFNIKVPNYEIIFLSFLFSTLMLIPFMVYQRKFKTKHSFLHISRAILLFLGIIIKYFCLQYVQITTVTLIYFMSPIFFLILACFFLHEDISWKRWLASFVNFIGIIIALNPNEISFHSASYLLIISSILFSVLHILNKKYIFRENTLNMLFYLFLYTTLFSALPLLYIGWIDISTNEIIICILLGIISNLIAFTLVKSFSLINASFLSPLKYLALPISIILGYLIFDELPSKSLCIGSIIILGNILFYINTLKKL